MRYVIYLLDQNNVFFSFKKHIKYTVYYIFICHILFYCIYRHYVSQRQIIFQFNM